MTPKKTKFSYNHLVKYEGKAKGNTKLDYGDFGLQSCEGNYISNRAIEAARKVISPVIKKHGKKHGKIYIRIYPHLGRTKKPLETRMGQGKGRIET
jgi:large subunit ribosomal protein L16